MKKNRNKITFWSTMTKALKDGYNKYKSEMTKEVEKHRLLSSKSDWSMLESLIRKCNEDPNLKVEVTLYDGTKITMRSYEKVPMKDYELLEIN